MNALYYLAMLIGILWLAVWSILPAEHRRRGWWPFDMREVGGDIDGATAAPPDHGSRTRRPDRGRPVVEPPAGRAPVAGAREAPPSWRSRRSSAARRRT
jgi:hypothetical protein